MVDMTIWMFFLGDIVRIVENNNSFIHVSKSEDYNIKHVHCYGHVEAVVRKRNK
jgi:hypothetical protein